MIQLSDYRCPSRVGVRAQTHDGSSLRADPDTAPTSRCDDAVMAPVVSRALVAAATAVPGAGVVLVLFSRHSSIDDLVPHVLALVAVGVGWVVVVRLPDSPVVALMSLGAEALALG